MDCLVCGQKNSDQSLTCGGCGEMLLHHGGDSRLPREPLTLAGPTYAAAPPRLALHHEWRARSFALLAFALLGVLVVASGLHLLPDFEVVRVLNGIFGSGWHLAAYLLVVHAFLLGSTARAMGLNFWAYGVLGLVPPLVPLAWARIAQTAWWKPYVVLAVTLAVTAGLSWWLREVSWAVALVWLAAVPFLISGWLGGSVIAIARLLGLNSYLAGSWVCLAPTVIGGFIAWRWRVVELAEMAFDPNDTLRGCLQAAVGMIDFSALPLDLTLLAATWGVLTLLLWVKAIHDNMRFPTL
jgi:hypothetical protein